ncbi:MAG TPA: 50S ribosomal protein L29 [Phycisphaerales bacterium]|nr:50S ribosomal protein L29 [Phycisphaerales bacterium]
MTGPEIRRMKDEELAIELRTLREKRFRMRTQAASEKIEDTSLFRKVRRDIARLETERSRRRAAAGARA